MYIRTGILDENGNDTGIDPFMASYPHLIDVGIMGHCIHGKTGLCVRSGIGCYQSGLLIEQSNMAVEDFRSIADQSRDRCNQFDLGCRGYTDQHEHFEEILKICKENILVPNFTTSGYGMTPEMAALDWGAPESIGVCFNDIHTPNSAAVQALNYEEWGCKEYEWDEGVLREMCDAMPNILKAEELQDFVNKYSHIGAVSIMLRGGFKNLLEAYLSANPPIDAFYDDMCEVLSNVGHKQVYEVLKDYKV